MGSMIHICWSINFFIVWWPSCHKPIEPDWLFFLRHHLCIGWPLAPLGSSSALYQVLVLLGVTVTLAGSKPVEVSRFSHWQPDHVAGSTWWNSNGFQKNDLLWTYFTSTYWESRPTLSLHKARLANLPTYFCGEHLGEVMSLEVMGLTLNSKLYIISLR